MAAQPQSPLALARRANVERIQAFQTELDKFAPSIEQALPAHVDIDKFKRVLVTAVATNPDLLYADRRTLYNSAVKAAVDGLMPDGKDCALVVYNTEIKMRNPGTGLDEKFRIDAVQYLPMVAGIKRRMTNSGEVLTVEAEVVCRNDRFRYALGDQPFIEHEPPALGEERGEIIGAYAIIRLRNGGIIRDVMSRQRIEQAHGQSRQKEGLMWTKFYDEACCKTVLKHASKDAPQSAEITRLFDRDDEPPILDDIPGFPAIERTPVPPEPVRPTVIEHEEDSEPTFAVIDLDGNELDLSAGATDKALRLLLEEAARRGLGALDGCYETNLATIEALGKQIGGDLAVLYRGLRDIAAERDTAAGRAERVGGPQTSESAERPAAGGNPVPPPSAPPAPPAGPPPRPTAAPAASAPGATSTTPAPAAGPSSTGEPVPFPLDNPTDESTEDGAFRVDDPPMRSGRRDWRAWSVAIFQPRMRKDINNSTDFALFLADNDENLRAARSGLTSGDANALERAIEEKWRELG